MSIYTIENIDANAIIASSTTAPNRMNMKRRIIAEADRILLGRLAHSHEPAFALVAPVLLDIARSWSISIVVITNADEVIAHRASASGDMRSETMINWMMAKPQRNINLVLNPVGRALHVQFCSAREAVAIVARDSTMMSAYVKRAGD